MDSESTDLQDFQDKEIVCADCGESFVFSADEQSFYREKGLAHEPKRCRSCRAARKSQNRGGRRPGAGRRFREGGPPPRAAEHGGGGRFRNPNRGADTTAAGGRPPLFKADFGPAPWSQGSGGRERRRGGGRRPQGRGGQRPLYEAVCADCASPTRVPFRPNGVQPVYCRTCLPKHKPRKFEPGSDG